MYYITSRQILMYKDGPRDEKVNTSPKYYPSWKILIDVMVVDLTKKIIKSH